MKPLFFAIVATVLVGCAHHEAVKREVPPKREFALSEIQREVAQREAFKGDKAAARRLAAA